MWVYIWTKLQIIKKEKIVEELDTLLYNYSVILLLPYLDIHMILHSLDIYLAWVRVRFWFRMQSYQNRSHAFLTVTDSKDSLLSTIQFVWI